MRDADGLHIPQRTLDILEAAVEIERADAKQAGSMTFLARIFCQSALPYRSPGDHVGSWARANGNMTLRVRPRDLTAPGGPEKYGWAYGVIPRLLLVWLTTQVVQDGPAVEDRTVHLGGSLTGFLAELGMSCTGGATGTARRVREQIANLAGSSINVELTRREGDYSTLRMLNTQVADEVFLCWSNNDPMGDENPFEPTITLTQPMYDMMKTSGVPLDSRALQGLRTTGGGGLALDIYTWLVHRLAYLSRPTTIPWELLSLQFGSQYKRPRAFKAKFLTQLPPVLAVYPGANVKVTDAGLHLRPSPPAVPRKSVAA